MKKLNVFISFNADGFLKDKRLIVLSCREWQDFNTKNHVGTIVEVVIAQDKTNYGEEGITNLYEKLNIKVPKIITVPMNAEVRLVNAVGKVYGDYHNRLSLSAEDIEIVGK